MFLKGDTKVCLSCLTKMMPFAFIDKKKKLCC